MTMTMTMLADPKLAASSLRNAQTIVGAWLVESIHAQASGAPARIAEAVEVGGVLLTCSSPPKPGFRPFPPLQPHTPPEPNVTPPKKNTPSSKATKETNVTNVTKASPATQATKTKKAPSRPHSDRNQGPHNLTGGRGDRQIIGARVTPAQYQTFHALGGSVWLRAQLDAAS